MQSPRRLSANSRTKPHLMCIISHAHLYLTQPRSYLPWSYPATPPSYSGPTLPRPYSARTCPVPVLDNPVLTIPHLASVLACSAPAYFEYREKIYSQLLRSLNNEYLTTKTDQFLISKQKSKLKIYVYQVLKKTLNILSRSPI